MTKVKICGLNTVDAITVSIAEGADFIGFVFYSKSPRHLDIEVAAYLSAFIPESVKKVGLFVDPDHDYLKQVSNNVSLDMIQLHGQETSEECLAIRGRFEKPIIKALSINSKDDIDSASLYDKSADWLLFDAKPEELPGGNGYTFDWSLLKHYQGETPWMLAGGLTPENVQDAINDTHPHAVDVSSGVESGRGQKDGEKIRSFLQAVKQA
ncbi:MAG: phosphoribosylanthranilate isomerase [Pseudomonadota bacterium]